MKTRFPKLQSTIFTTLICWSFLNLVYADEGMWLFEQPPTKQVQEKYGFELTPEWLQHVQQSSIRFARRGSASFVSSQGLIMTNHHVGARNLHELSTPENNLLENGFYAKTFDDELPCKGLEIFVPVSSEDVTEKVNAVVTPEMSAEESQKSRNAVIATLEKEASAKESNQGKLRYEVTTLYQGGAYWLYGYKVYNDVRLVWAPEQTIAAFGGDPDNYEYPRYCVDCSLFRAYENGKPAKIEHFLKWSTDGVKDGELVFVSGFPGKTERSYTREHLEFQLDVYFPYRLQKLYRREVIYSTFGNRNIENQRRIADDLGSVQNYRKRAVGQLQGLRTPSLWKHLPRITPAKDSPEKKIMNACLTAYNGQYVAYDLFELGEAFNCQTFKIARMLVRLVYETEKPNSERLKEYRDGNLESLKQTLFADTPIYEDVEILKLTDSLNLIRDVYRGSWNSWVPVLDFDLSPKESATELILRSKVRDVAERKRIAEGGIKEIKYSGDPMIQLALRLEPIAKKYREDYENNVEAPITAAYAELAKKRFEKSGTSVYPDATFTLRLSYGAVKGYKEDDGTKVAPITTIAGMFDRAKKQKFKEPFDPPKSWKDGKTKLNPATPFNLVTTNDIIGGNSGSPLINTKGEVLGLAFDGNIYSLSNNFVYTETQSRCVSVHADVIIESLRKIYGADRIADELGK
ncbi:MAG: S46 family peptidase [Planctomycetaceae bacterium]|nr:S46 family peptidase [Planctomycetaceae bacterium]